MTIEVVFSPLQRLAFKSGDDPRQVHCLSQTAEAGLRHGNSRLQEAHVPDAWASAVSFDLVTVDLDHLLEIEEDGEHRLVPFQLIAANRRREAC